jgi:hypothetical protein
MRQAAKSRLPGFDSTMLQLVQQMRLNKCENIRLIKDGVCAGNCGAY